MYSFDFKQPATTDEAVAAVAAGGQVLGGGQTLIPTLKMRLADPGVLVSLGRIPGLAGIRTDSDGRLCIGAAATHAAVADGAGAYPALASLAGRIGDPAVRNRGTIGGSLANNDPAACYPAAALASGATVVTSSREIHADDFFAGMFETALEEGEIITEIRFPIPLAAAYGKFLQPASRFALVGVFVARFADGVRVAVTGASEDGVYRWSEAETALSNDFSASALDPLSVSGDGMFHDVHGTPEYRANLVKVMAGRAVAAC